jgi:aryl-alcohol dehydrogenase-like predicted oxidoreductase
MGAFMHNRMTDDALDAVQRLRPIAADLGITLPQLALAWVLRRPEVSSAIVGATRPEQVEENAAASGVRLDAATLARVDEAVAGVRTTTSG